MKNLQVGDKVRFNENVANAFVGKEGIIESEKDEMGRVNIHGKKPVLAHLFIVKLDEPTPAFTYGTPLKTLGVTEKYIDRI